MAGCRRAAARVGRPMRSDDPWPRPGRIPRRVANILRGGNVHPKRSPFPGPKRRRQGRAPPSPPVRPHPPCVRPNALAGAAAAHDNKVRRGRDGSGRCCRPLPIVRGGVDAGPPVGWQRDGGHLAHLWPISGPSLAHLWPIPGPSLASLAHLWPIPGPSLAHPWPIPGPSLAHPWPWACGDVQARAVRELGGAISLSPGIKRRELG
jgi:hypothetical protein